MKNLTQEQADHLINVFNQLILTAPNAIDAIRQIIRNRTEKAFPEFKVDCEDGEIQIMKLDYTEHDIGIGTDEENLFYLNKKQFKQFTEGCQKICEWLGEQE